MVEKLQIWCIWFERNGVVRKVTKKLALVETGQHNQSYQKFLTDRKRKVVKERERMKNWWGINKRNLLSWNLEENQINPIWMKTYRTTKVVKYSVKKLNILQVRKTDNGSKKGKENLLWPGKQHVLFEVLQVDGSKICYEYCYCFCSWMKSTLITMSASSYLVFDSCWFEFKFQSDENLWRVTSEGSRKVRRFTQMDSKYWNSRKREKDVILLKT